MVENFKKLRSTKRDCSSDDENHSTENSFNEIFSNINTFINLDSDENDFKSLKEKYEEKSKENQIIFKTPEISILMENRGDFNYSPSFRKLTFPNQNPIGNSFYPNNISPLTFLPPLISRESEYNTKYDSLE